MQLSLAVSRDSSYNWQKGSWGFFTQFLSVQVKGASAMSVSKRFTDAEKGWIAAGQVLYHGAQAFGLSKTFDNVLNTLNIEQTPAARAATMGGLVDLMFYQVLGEHINFSKSMAVAGGINETLWGHLDSFMGKGGKAWYSAIPAVSAVGYAQGALGGRVGLMFKEMESILGTREFKPTKENAGQLIDAYLSLGSGWNNYSKAVMAEKFNSWVSSRGDVLGIEPSKGALLARKLLGVGPQSEQDFYKLRELQVGVGGGKDKEDTLKTAGADLAKQYKMYIAKYQELSENTNRPDLRHELSKNFEMINNLIKFSHGEDNFTVIKMNAYDTLSNSSPKSLYALQKAMLGDISAGLTYSQGDQEKMLTFIKSTLQGLSDTQKDDVLTTIRMIRNR